MDIKHLYPLIPQEFTEEVRVLSIEPSEQQVFIDAIFPSQIGNAGKFLQTNGSSLLWAATGGGFITSVADTSTINLTVLAGLLTADLVVPVAAVNGGTGLSAYTTGDILYASAANTLLNLPGNTTTLTKYLTQAGDGTSSAAPQWMSMPIASLGVYFFYNIASSIATYLQMIGTPSTGILQTITNTGVINGQMLSTFATNANIPNKTFLPAAVVNFYCHAHQTAGTKTSQLYFELYSRTSGGTETLLCTSGNTAVLSGVDADYQTDASLPATTLNADDRLVVKIKALVSGVGSAPDIELDIEGNTLSRVEVPVPSNTAQALTKTDDTNVTLTLGGSPTVSLLAATSLTLGWSGTLSGARGGTGVANTGLTITLAGNLVTTGAFNTTFAQGASTTQTLPTISDTLAGLTSTQTFSSGVKTFNSSILAFRNPANTFSYSIASAAITANRTLTLPLITGSDTLCSRGINNTFTVSQTIGSTAGLHSTISIFGYSVLTGSTTQGIVQYDQANALFFINNATSAEYISLFDSGGIGLGTDNTVLANNTLVVDSANSKISVLSGVTINTTLQAFDDDAAAGTGGLVTGDLFQTTGAGIITTAGVVMIKQ